MTLQASGQISLGNIQTEFGGTNPISINEYYRNGAYVTGNNTNIPTSGQISFSQFYSGLKYPVGQIEYTTQGLYTFVVPANVTSVCVVCVGPGNSSPYAGGALSWGNDIAVTPGQNINVGVNYYDGTKIGASFGSSSILFAGAGTDVAGTSRGGGGNGGTSAGTSGSGMGGAGGYSGNGGAGGAGGGAPTAGSAGAGGGGGGGGGASDLRYSGGGGGGVGLLGQGSNGAGGTLGVSGGGGGGGSGGTSGANGDLLTTNSGGAGGLYGGQGGVANSVSTGNAGAVRIIWGYGRAFPSTNTGNL